MKNWELVIKNLPERLEMEIDFSVEGCEDWDKQIDLKGFEQSIKNSDKMIQTF